MENFQFLITLDDDKTHVIREIGIQGNQHLEDLHHLIFTSFGLHEGEMASFYFTNEDWEQLDEIPMMAFDEATLLTMSQLKIEDVFATHKKLLYVYDFFNMWTFYVELKEQGEGKKLGLINTIGLLPEVAPNKDFSGSELMEGYQTEGGFHSPDGDEDMLDEENYQDFNDEEY